MRLYARYLGIYFKGIMQYKSSFALQFASQFVGTFAAFLGVRFLFLRFDSLKGFTFPQVLLCFGIVSAAFSLAECFFRGFDRFPVILGNGQFDRILTRPRSPVFQVLAGTVDFSRMGRVLQALIVLAYALTHAGVAWTVGKALLVLMMLLSGMAVFSSLFVIYAAICFWTTESLEVLNILTDGGREFGAYPLSVYGESTLRFLTFVVPLALFQYYPLLVLLDQSRSIWHMLAPLAALLFMLPAWGLWRLGLHKYKSTGS